MAYRNPYQWYIETPIKGISNCLPMVFRTPYPCYIEPPTHGISNPLPMVWRPPFMVLWTPYRWYIEPLTNGILKSPIKGISNRLPIECQTPYPWYIEPPLMVFCSPNNRISNPLSMVYRTSSLGRNEVVQFTLMGFKIQWRKCAPGVKTPYGILNPELIFQGFKIPYDTGLWWFSCFAIKFSV